MSHDGSLLSVEDMSEIPSTSNHSGSAGASKGVNLFLARQKLIADMMEQEEQEGSHAAGSNGVGGLLRVASHLSLAHLSVCLTLFLML